MVEATDERGRTSRVKVVAGAYGDVHPLDPPPHSWAARPEAGVAVWHVTMESGARLDLPAATVPGVVRTLYVYDGELAVDGQRLAAEGAVVTPEESLSVAAGQARTRFLLLQGRPIGAPVVQQGPFVANTREELVQAFEDYRAGRFGQWGLPEDGPVQPRDRGRFARYPDGTQIAPR